MLTPSFAIFSQFNINLLFFSHHRLLTIQFYSFNSYLAIYIGAFLSKPKSYKFKFPVHTNKIVVFDSFTESCIWYFYVIIYYRRFIFKFFFCLDSTFYFILQVIVFLHCKCYKNISTMEQKKKTANANNNNKRI